MGADGGRRAFDRLQARPCLREDHLAELAFLLHGDVRHGPGSDAVVLPQEEWDSLAGEDGRVVAVATGDIVHVPVTDDAATSIDHRVTSFFSDTNAARALPIRP